MFACAPTRLAAGYAAAGRVLEPLRAPHGVVQSTVETGTEKSPFCESGGKLLQEKLQKLAISVEVGSIVNSVLERSLPFVLVYFAAFLFLKYCREEAV